MPAPNVAEKRHGGNVVADVLKKNDVNSIFVLSGGHVSPIFVGCEELGIRVIGEQLITSVVVTLLIQFYFQCFRENG